jgi:hypothetical protein
MFGINEITWKTFLLFVTALLLLYYNSLFVLAWVKGKNKGRMDHYENELSYGDSGESFCPISVSSGQFPSEILSWVQEEDVPLEVTLYDASGLDEGIGLDDILEDTGEELPRWMEQIQIQH